MTIGQTKCCKTQGLTKQMISSPQLIISWGRQDWRFIFYMLQHRLLKYHYVVIPQPVYTALHIAQHPRPILVAHLPQDVNR
jgi:hypothetical protein